MTRIGLFLASLLLMFATGAAAASTPLENFFKNPKIGAATLSPNGKHLAITTGIDGRMQLAVVDVETGFIKNIAGYKDLDVVAARWINDERLVFSIVDRDGEQRSSGVGLYAINRDGSQEMTLMQSPEHIRGHIDMAAWASEPRWMHMADAFRDDPNYIIGLGYFPNRNVLPYRIDSLTGKRKEVEFDLNGLARNFVFDQRNLLRVVVVTNANQSQLAVWYRDQLGQAWQKLSEHSSLDPRFTVMAFDADSTTMIVSAPTSQGRKGIYKYDFSTNAPGELLASDPLVDVDSGLVFAPDTRKLLGVRMNTEPPKTLWFDKGLASLQTGIDKALSGQVNVIHPGNAQAAMLISSYSSTNPGKYLLYFPDKKKLQNLLTTRPWIESGEMSRQLVYDYAARDGLPITAYLTLPWGREPKGLPMVVVVHGGPWARDGWGFNPEVQFLAGLGYAVLQPQFRGSTGFGEAHFKKSFSQWGLSMQDDVTDGVSSLVKQGVVDPKRVCIMGASYGGYAAMMGLVKDPDLYRCGVNLFGVTNIPYLFSQGAWSDDRVAEYSFREMVGDPDKLRDQFNLTSPSKHGDKIKAPVLMVYGEKDYRVPLVHGEEMLDGLRKNGKVYQYTELEKEEHGIAKEETRFKVYRDIEAFLKKYNPPQ